MSQNTQVVLDALEQQRCDHLDLVLRPDTYEYPLIRGARDRRPNLSMSSIAVDNPSRRWTDRRGSDLGHPCLLVADPAWQPPPRTAERWRVHTESPPYRLLVPSFVAGGSDGYTP